MATIINTPGIPVPTPAPELAQQEISSFLLRQQRLGLLTARRRARALYLRPIESSLSNRVTKLSREKFKTERGLWFPVAPQEYSVSGSGVWNKKSIVSGPPIPHPAGPSLRTVSFSSFFPSLELRGLSEIERLCGGLRSFEDYMDPSYACYLLEILRDTNDIFWLIVGTDVASEDPGNPFRQTGSDVPSNILKMPAYISEFTWSEAAGRRSDRLFSITFEEFVPEYITQRGATRITPIPKTYQPKDGEDLVDVALRFYGQASQWKAIAAYNRFDKPYSRVIPKKKGKPVTLKLPKGQAVPTAPTGRARSTSVRAVPSPTKAFDD